MNLVKMDVDGVVLNLANQSPVVILKSEKGDVLPVVIGVFEAQAILLVLEKKDFPRPLTHDLIKLVIERFGRKMLRLEIHSLRDRVYYADLVMEYSGTTERVDCRPSDGVALALRFGVPILAAEDLLQGAETIQYYQDSEYVSAGSLDTPIGRKDAEAFHKALESESAEDFWKKLKQE